MFILIDGNAVGHAHHNASTLTKPGTTFQVQAIYGYARMLRDMRATYPTATMIVLWDGRADFRYDLFPEYKGKRKEVAAATPEASEFREAYQHQLPHIQELITHSGISQIHHPKLEADDLAGIMCRKLPEGSEIMLVTSDKDWLQLVTPLIDWYDPRGATRRVTFKSFEDFTGYKTPRAFLQGKALQGDSSDSIPGVGGIGAKTAIKIIEEWGDVMSFFLALRKGHTPKGVVMQRLASPEGQEIYARNLKLMDLMSNAHDEMALKSGVTKGKLDTIAMRNLCDDFGFLSITRNWGMWVMPFVPASTITGLFKAASVAAL
jgi:DNA polymerase I